MDKLPIDVLPIVFGYLDAKTCIGCRLVCRKWQRMAGKGCAFVRVKNGTLDPSRQEVVGRLTLNGSSGEEQMGSNCQQNKRTRGHLPEPRVLHSKQQTTSLTFLSSLARFDDRYSRVFPNAVATENHVFALKLERGCDESRLASLDLEKSSFEVASRCLDIMDWIPNVLPRLDVLYDNIQGKPRKLKRALEVLSLSGLHYLQRLSVRGCSSLETLYLPPSVVALDASGCTALRRICMPQSIHGDGLTALNLNGCRSLEPTNESLFGSHTIKQAMTNVVDVDMSAISPNLVPVLANALQATTRNETLSLRYVATDSIIMALSKSASARESLRLLDVAFSTELTDAAVEALVASAPNLERFNLRGCKKVSVECYNKIPVLLMNRRADGNADTTESSLASSGSTERRARKGDNIFTFVGSGPPKPHKRIKLA